MKHARIERPRARGLTLVELMISIVILSVLLGGAVALTERGTKSYQHSVAESVLLGRAGRTLDRVLDAFVGAGRTSLDPPDPSAPWGCDSLDFRQSMGWDGDAVQWSTLRRVAFELEPTELDNDVDDDGDGRIDEGIVVLIDDPGGADERRRTVARDVRRFAEGEVRNGKDDDGNGLIDEAGFSIELIEEVLVIRLTLEDEGPDARMLVKSFTSSTRLRN